MSDKLFQDMMIQKTPVTIKTPYLSKYEGFRESQKKFTKLEDKLRNSSQTSLMQAVNKIDDSRRSLTSLAMQDDNKIKDQRKSSLGRIPILDISSQTDFLPNDITSLNTTKRQQFKDLIKLNRELKALRQVSKGYTDIGVSADFSTDGLTDQGSPKDEHLRVLPINSPHKKGVISSIMRRNFKLNQQASTERNQIQEAKTPGTLRMNDSDYRDNGMSSSRREFLPKKHLQKLQDEVNNSVNSEESNASKEPKRVQFSFTKGSNF